jgi:hypothetical protein
MSDPATNNDLIIAWHGVDGDTRTFWAELGPYPEAPAPTTLPSGIPHPNTVLDASSFAAPGLDPSAQLVATVGPGSPSAIRLRSVGLENSAGTGPAVPAAFQTSARPAVASISGGGAILAWQRPSDDVICVATEKGGQWSTPAPLTASTHGPAVAFNNRAYLVAFIGANNQIYGSINGGRPIPMHPQQGGMSSSDIPALCWGEGNFWMAWKGVPGDDHIWVAGSQDGTDWSAPQQANPSSGAILASTGPAIAIWQGGLVLAWRGIDDKLWWSAQRIGNLAAPWQTPVVVSPADNTNAGPTLGTRGVNTF